MRLGIDVLFDDASAVARLASARVGILAHAASVDRNGVHIIERMREAGIVPRRVFTPEHGLWGVAQDMEGVEGGHDEISGLDTVSLYGMSRESLYPDSGLLAGLDEILIDVQDVGSRYYTFVYTALFLAEAAARHGIRVTVLDRPNPIGGTEVEGNLVRPECRSFVGERTMAVRHGMTVGEMVLMWCREDGLADGVNVVRMDGYERGVYYESYEGRGGFWVMPSPNMPTNDTAVVYPGMCLIEGTNLSEGRGTTRPFELFGAPWLNVRAVGDALRSLSLPGAAFRETDFRPMFQKHAGVVCHGFQLHVTDRASFRPWLTGLAVISAVRAIHPEFSWRTEAYEFVGDRPAIDLLLGASEYRLMLESQDSPYRIAERAREESSEWRDIRAANMLYG